MFWLLGKSWSTMYSWYCVSFLLLFLLCKSPCVVLSARATPQQQQQHKLSRLVGALKGSCVEGMSNVKQYFHRFGYLASTSFDDKFDSQFESALILYQTKMGLPVTAKLDSDTVSSMMLPRCGVSDSDNINIHTTQHYAYFYGKPRWERMSLTYAFSPDHTINYLSSKAVAAVFRRSFSRWSTVIPLNFTHTQEYSLADIKIGFYRGEHGDGEPFDGLLGVLAHAFSPQNGRFHLDAAESWAIPIHDNFGSLKSAIDLESVVTHEIGHVLGLGHSSLKEAVMYPSLTPRTKKVELKMDDVKGVQALYGSNPNFKLTSFLASQDSDSHNNNYQHSSNSPIIFPFSTTNCSLTLPLLLFLLFYFF